MPDQYATWDRDDSRANSPPTRWQFIDTSNNSRSNLTQVKRHVMQEYMRQKRQDTDSNPEKPVNESSISQHRPRRRSKRTEESGRDVRAIGKKGYDNVQSREESGPSSTRQTTANLSPDPFLASSSTTYTEPGFIPGAESPLPPHVSLTPSFPDAYALWDQASGLGFGSQTPLSPVTELLDSFTNEMTSHPYGSHLPSANANNWCTSDFAPEATTGNASFRDGGAVHAANTWTGGRSDDGSSLAHQHQASFTDQERLEDIPGDISDGAIVSSLSAAGLEDSDPRPGRKEISWMHMRTAREMIRARGGPAAFHNTRLGILINWQDYILPGYDTNGPSFSFEPRPAASQPVLRPNSAAASWGTSPGVAPSASTLSPLDEIRQQCEEFIDFLKRCEELSMYHRSCDPTSMPVRHTAFQPTSPVYRALTAPANMRTPTPEGGRQFIARLVNLMLVSAALWDYRCSAQQSEGFLRTVQQAVMAQDANVGGSAETLLLTMLEYNDRMGSVTDETGPVSFGRPWFAGRMLKVAKRLSLGMWMHVQDFLLSCLALHSPAGMVSVEMWAEALRHEVLSAPLTSYVMPALRG
ncbi:hypothetical protein P168DRAFT_229478 [Aspergillus campestris IBT 28561]|uniref:Transcription factor domain-containing protein n=1 Tax=Aspergillus campestris (strain IBT 28561) TaxID=1392248 RepID=A0A2I1DEN6_ASPC2|nr:uncharacterized protein P168DRAFT_229478 [Aspergillus campestris IBT 28561]PKY08326.1 hypothetical protein P168DRAFT_229478 [Aspergillus campestris IBT 28561]